MPAWIHQLLAERYPTIVSAVTEIAALKARLQQPKGVIHVISDVHGDDKKLRHVINNASGRLRPQVEKLFAADLDETVFHEFINVLYYPAEILQAKSDELADPETRFRWVLATLHRQFALLRHLVRTSRRETFQALVPPEYSELFDLLLNFPAGGYPEDALHLQIRELSRRRLDLPVVHAASRLIRGLSVEELIVAGDLGDRGPRLDRVIDILQHQPNAALVWGNHDVSWMGACLGQEALIAVVMRISLRYRRLYQLEEGYGLLTKALERLAQTVYQDDPATRFVSKREGVRDPLVIARMQKAAAILEFKLQGQAIERHPEWKMDDRNLLPRIDLEKGTVTLATGTYELCDTFLPTFDPADPNRLSAEEQLCLDRLKESFTTSPRLWEHMKWVAEKGRMALVRDRAAIFHACLAVDETGSYLPMPIGDREISGPDQFPALDRVVKRAFRAGTAATTADKDLFYYLWAGPASPLFGKNQMSTFETYFVGDKSTHREIKNPWFRLINDRAFCDRVCREMGIPEGGLIVNGHVPVNIEEGESPLKAGGNAITIDGAFSEVYGDRGYTLILAPEGEILAEHHAFHDPVVSVRQGKDLIPETNVIRQYETRRLVRDTEKGAALLEKIAALEALVTAYQDGTM